jgi:hypothetical protein
LRTTLNVLAFIDMGGMQLEPGTVQAIGACFTALQHLDMSDTFSSEHYEFSGDGGYFDDPNVEAVYPYDDEPLRQCVKALPNLKKLHDVEEMMQDKNQGYVTMEDERVPYPWPNDDDGMAEHWARKRVLMTLAANEDETPTMRSLATEALANLS